MVKRAKNIIVDLGYDPVYGARPIRRSIMSNLSDRLSTSILKSSSKSSQLIVDKMDGPRGNNGELLVSTHPALVAFLKANGIPYISAVSKKSS